jgi:hypothetical protein
MKITLEIPNELVPAVIRIMESRVFPEDDGMTDVILMEELDISVNDFVRADHIVDEILTKIKENIK